MLLNKVWLGPIAVIGFATLGVSARSGMASSPLGAKEIIDKSIEAVKLDGSEMVSTLTIKNKKGQSRVRSLASVQKLFDDGETEKRLLRFTEPADVKGTGLLTYDYENKSDDMWLFMPALRKTRRIVASDKAKSFMGSEFSYADIAPPPLDHFVYTMQGDETVAGEACWVIEQKPKTEAIAEENGYSKRVVHVAKSDFVIRKSVYYDLGGALLKELLVHEVRKVDPSKNKYRATHMVMSNKQNGRSSILKVSKIQLRPSVPDEYFTTRYLERQ